MKHTVDIILLEGASPDGLAEPLAAAGLTVGSVRQLPPSPQIWKGALGDFLRGGSACLLTVGGVVPPQDFLPELLLPLVTRPVPGIPEAIRALPEASPAEAALFRGTAGITAQGRILVNLPASGSWRASAVSFLARILPHALDKAAGDQAECGAPAPR